MVILRIMGNFPSAFRPAKPDRMESDRFTPQANDIRKIVGEIQWYRILADWKAA